MDAQVITTVLNQYTSRFSSLRTQRLSWWAHWAQCAENYLPRRYKWFVTPNQSNRGAQMNQNIIDETGVLAARILSTGMLSGLTSPTRPWFKYILEDKGLMSFGPIKTWLAQCEKVTYRVLARSNFYQSMGVLYHDEAVFGSASAICYSDPETVVRFFNPCLGEFFFALDNKLEVTTHAREFTYTVQETVQEFELKNCSQSVQQSYRSGAANLDREVVIQHIIEPNEVAYAAGEPLGRLAPKHFKYREVYWEQGSQEKKFLRVKGFHEKPFVAARWDVTSNDPYGRSPGMDGLPACRQLQIEQRRKAEAIDKMVRPPMVAHVSMRHEPTSILPGGTNYVADMSNVGFKPAFMVDPRLAEMMEDIKEVQNRLNSIFFVDLFMMISQLETVRTATEIDARREEKLIQLGPVIERAETEVLDVHLTRVFNECLRRGLFPPAPPEIRGQEIHVQYISMLAEAQRAASTASIERLFGLAGNLAGVKPEVLDNIDFDEGLDEYADLLGVSPKIIVPLKKVIQIRLQRQKQQAAQQQLQLTQAGVEGAQTLSNTKLGGGKSALDMMMGNQA